MTQYRIQLASNFQVVEFNLAIDEDLDESLSIEDPRISEAVSLVNKLGEVVVNTIKSKDGKTEIKAEKIEPATDKQLHMLDKFGIKYRPDVSKKEAWSLLNEAMKP